MWTFWKPKTPSELRAELLTEHQRRQTVAEMHYEQAKANLDMERAIVRRLSVEPLVLMDPITMYSSPSNVTVQP
jgi:hypothetical protein